MEVRAVNKYVGISPLKVRLVVNRVRGQRAQEALVMLRFMTQAAAKQVAKTIRSAVANAEENFGLTAEDLYIAQIMADEAPMRHWRRFGARGRFKPLLRRASHITVVLDEVAES